MRDLFVLVADKNMNFALRGAFDRPHALGIRPIDHVILEHPQRDGGARTTGVDVLARQRHLFKHAMLVLDHEGSGVEDKMTPTEIEAKLDDALRSQWGVCAKSIVIAPELDIWMWGSDNALHQAFDWDIPGSIRDWLSTRGFLFSDGGKPHRPKEALEALLRNRGLPRSSALYEQLTRRISLSRCRDAAFARLKLALREWFPPTTAGA